MCSVFLQRTSRNAAIQLIFLVVFECCISECNVWRCRVRCESILLWRNCTFHGKKKMLPSPSAAKSFDLPCSSIRVMKTAQSALLFHYARLCFNYKMLWLFFNFLCMRPRVWWFLRSKKFDFPINSSARSVKVAARTVSSGYAWILSPHRIMNTHQ